MLIILPKLDNVIGSFSFSLGFFSPMPRFFNFNTPQQFMPVWWGFVLKPFNYFFSKRVIKEFRKSLSTFVPPTASQSLVVFHPVSCHIYCSSYEKEKTEGSDRIWCFITKHLPFKYIHYTYNIIQPYSIDLPPQSTTMNLLPGSNVWTWIFSALFLHPILVLRPELNDRLTY